MFLKFNMTTENLYYTSKVKTSNTVELSSNNHYNQK